MSKSSKDQMKLAVQLMRKGAVMLKEPCQVCNGVQVKYRGKTYCTSHDDLSVVLSATEVTYVETTVSLREILLLKLRDAMSQLKSEKDVKSQDDIASLMLKYIELLNKLPEAAEINR